MAVEITVPELGESLVEATVGRWLKGEGDAVAPGEAVVELETDKVNLEVPAPGGGTLASIVKPEGETVGIGDVLAVVAEGAPAPRPADGRPVAQQEAAEGVAHTAQPPSAATPPSEAASGGVRSTPLAKRMASEHDVDLERITGSGPSGRITRSDVASYLQTQTRADDDVAEEARAVADLSPIDRAQRPMVAPTGDAPAARLGGAEAPGGERHEERVRMSRRRQTIARRLVEAQHSAAMLTTFNEVDMTAIMDVRKRRRDAFKERYGVGLGFMSFFTKAVVGALKAFPQLNAEIQGDEMILKYYYDIGIAVAAEEGLVVPVVRDADRLSFAEIERQIAALAAKARDNTLSLAELQGGTFTVTNGGTFGSLLSTPILNAPQVGILGMHKIEERPIALKGEVVIRPMMYIALSYDHRIVDGSEAVRFLVRCKELLEDPETLLLEG